MKAQRFIETDFDGNITEPPVYIRENTKDESYDYTGRIRDALKAVGVDYSSVTKTTGKIADIYTVIAKENPTEKSKKIIKRLRYTTGAKGITMEETDVPYTTRLIIPHVERRKIYLSDIWEEQDTEAGEVVVPIGVGADDSLIHLDITGAPHILIAGTTGSGKSCLINNIIAGAIFSKAMPKVTVIDAKGQDFKAWERSPYVSVITDMKKGADILERYVATMNGRYRNGRKGNAVDIIIIDEAADIIKGASKEEREQIETNILRLMQKGRAAGIHVIISTQRPSVDIINGVIKANAPVRIALKTRTATDSRVILDRKGAEDLHGAGDFILDGQGTAYGQAAYVSEEDIEDMAEYLNPYKIVEWKKRRGDFDI